MRHREKGFGMIADDFPPHLLPFEVRQPIRQTVPLIFNSPHSGAIYPPGMVARSRLSAKDLRRSEDVMVDALFDSAARFGAPQLIANFPRAWLDVNREPYELDPLLFRERLPAHANSRSARVAGGLGTIPRLISEHQPIYHTPPTLEDALSRIENIYRPYHETLRRLIGHTAGRFGHAILVDCHSMPSQGSTRETQERPDIVIGDRYGTSCNEAIALLLERQFDALGYRTTRNKPYAGGFITEHYGRPARGLHAVQIEINRGLYMSESTLRIHDGFDRLKADIEAVMGKMAAPDAFTHLAHAVAAE